MSNIEFNKEKCIQCGACIKDCITYSIEFGDDNFPQYSQGGESRCISCQHCFAICPTGAITFNNKTPESAKESSFASPEDILKTIKSRRSIRQFKSQEISEEDFTHVQDIVKNAGELDKNAPYDKLIDNSFAK